MKNKKYNKDTFEPLKWWFAKNFVRIGSNVLAKSL